jgi:ADP-L-glycero-D-manno-heptose 6-epimerase
LIIVTGGAGFIGSNKVRELNRRGRTDLLVVDNLERPEKFRNLADLVIQDYMDKREFRARLERGSFDLKVDAILHDGACSDTMGGDGRYMLENNFGDSKVILHYALAKAIPLVYASSAATYGPGPVFVPDPANERPLNVYGYSKLLFDQHVRHLLPDARSTVVGLRYFNVYGPREDHKGRMMSVLHQLLRQLRETGVCRLFEGTDGYGPGEQVRDFVHVGDIVDIGLHFAEGPVVKGIFNAGTGKARSFNAIAQTLIQLLGKGRIEYIPFPAALAGKYQSFTQADLTTLRAAGYTRPMTELEDGIRKTLAEL